MHAYTRLLCVWLVVLASCGVAHKKATTTLTSVDYDSKTDRTIYMVFPYGSVKLPGKWLKGAYNQPSRQQYFRRADSLRLGIAIGPASHLEFYRQGMEGLAFATAYYEWETKYQREQLHQKTQLLRADTARGYTIWRVYSESVDMVQLCAWTKCACNEPAFKSLSVSTKKFPVQQSARLLEEIYRTE